MKNRSTKKQKLISPAGNINITIKSPSPSQLDYEMTDQTQRNRKKAETYNINYSSFLLRT
jgi:hypothetical protein